MAHETVIRSSLLVRDVENPNASAQKFAVFTGTGTSSLNTLGFRTANELLSDLGFNEAVDDRVASLLQAGSNISIAYDDNANTVTISAPNIVTGSGTATRVAFWSSGTSLSSSSNLFWDNSTNELGIRTGNPEGTLHVVGADSNSTAYTAIFRNSTAIHTLIVRNDGRVGIGIDSPAQTLHVAGTMRLTGSNGTGTTLVSRNASGDISATTIGTGLSLSDNVLSFSGNTGVSGSGAANKITYWSSASAITSDTDLHWDPTTNRLGIGTASPNQTIEVAGTMRLTGSTGTGTTLMARDANGDVSAITVSTGLALSNNILTASGGVTGTGTPTRLAFWGTASSLSSNANLYWDNTTNRLGVGTSAPNQTLQVTGTMRLTSSTGTSTTVMGRNAAGDIAAITIGTGLDLSSNVLTVTGGTSGVSGTIATGQVAYGTATDTIGGTNNLFWDNAAIELGIGTNAPARTLHVAGTMRLTGSTGTGTTLMARDANGDVSAITVSTGLTLSNNVLTSIGFSNPMTTLGDTLYGAASGVATRLAGNTTATKQFLSSTGNGTTSAAPSWSVVTKSDVGLANVENTALSTWTGSTSITTLGTIATGTWNATIINVDKGGTGVGTLTGVVIGNGTSAMTAVAGTASQLLRRNAGNTAYEFFTHDFINQAGARTAISLTVTGSSGAATYNNSTGVLNVPTYTLAGLGGVSGTIATGQVAFGTASNTVGGTNNLFWDNATSELGIGTNAPARTLHVEGTMRLTGSTGTGTTLMARDANGDISAITVSTGLTLSNNVLTSTGLVNPMTTLGDIIYGAASGVATRLAGNTTTTKQFLSSTGNGSASAVPVWSALTSSDVGLGNVQNVALSTWTGSTSITTLGTITTGTWNATIINVDRGGTGVGTLTGVVIGNGTSAMTAVAGTASQLLRRNAGNTAYEFFTHDFINQAGARTAISLTVTGSSGAATYNNSTGVLNVPTYTLAGLGGVSGTIAAGQVAFGTASNTVGGTNNLFWDNAANELGIGTNAPARTLHVEGTMRLTGSTGTGTTLMARDANGDVSAVTVSTGLSLSNNVLTSTGLVNPMNTLGDTIYGGASGVATRLAGNTTTTKQFLSSTGNGTTAAAPSWSALTSSDVGLGNVQNVALSTWTGSTSITTLGTIATGTWNATIINVDKGGTGVGTLTGVVIGNGTSAMTAVAGTASQLLRRNSGNTAYEFFTPDYVNQAGARTAISLTVTGSSGAATYNNSTGVLNVPTYTLAGLGGVGGTGTANKLAYFSAASTLTSDTDLHWDATNNRLGILATSPAQTLHVAGTMRLTGSTGTGTTLMARDANGDVSAITVSTGLALSNNVLTATGGTSGIAGTIAAGQVAFGTASNTIGGNNNLFWDNTNIELGIGTNAPARTLHIAGTMRLTGSTGTGTTLMARDANGDVSAVTVSTGLSLSNNVLTSTGISGTGTANKIAYWSSASNITNDADLHWDPTTNSLGVAKASPEYTLDVAGNMRLTGSTGTGTTLMARDGGGAVSAITVSTGLSMTNNILRTTLNPVAETPSGLVNGSNVTYTLGTTPIGNESVIVFLNGVAQYNTIDYTVSGTTVTFTDAPATGSSIFAYYLA